MDDFHIVALVICLSSSLILQILANSWMCLLLMTTLSFKQEVVKVDMFYENVVPLMQPRLYRRYFCMYPNTMDHLTQYLAPSLQHINPTSNIPISKLAHLFGISEEPFLRHTESVLDAMIARINELIKWPEEHELDAYATEFNTIGRFFPNVIGAIDDIHLEIQLTEEKRRRRSYFCWKQYYSIHLQAVATYDLRFLDIFVGWPGRSHDARVFANNPLYRTLPARLRARNINRLSETYHIVGDSAFPLSPQLLTPFRNWDNLNAVERKYNRNLSSKRSNVERAFGLLLARFPRVNKLNQKTLQKKIKIVMRCCFLHNICILENDNIRFFLQRAQNLNIAQFNNQYRRLGTRVSRRFGTLKRLQMANIVFVN